MRTHVVVLTYKDFPVYVIPHPESNAELGELTDWIEKVNQYAQTIGLWHFHPMAMRDFGELPHPDDARLTWKH